MRPHSSLLFGAMLGLVVGQAVLDTAAAQGGQPQRQGGTMTSQQQSTPPMKQPKPADSTIAYREAATRMHLDMGVRYSGDADKDFATIIAAHGTGAVALARIELQYGSDPEMRALAEQVIAAHEKERALLQAWQAKHK